MASVAQLRANRLNAQKSTGPRTPEGKAAVAQNAVKHGLLAQQVVIRGEDPGEFELFRDRMVQDLDPAGSLEGLLAERVAHLGWRLRRAEGFERAAYATLETDYAAREASTPPALRRPQGEAQDDEETVLARVVVGDFGDARLLDRLLGYERRIENSLYRTMSELRKQRLLREAEGLELGSQTHDSAFGGPFRLQAGQESVGAGPRACPDDTGQPQQERGRPRGAAPTAPETPCGVTPNGAQGEERLCQTNPTDAGGDEDRAPYAETREEVGRGRPTYEEASDDATTNAASVELAHRSNILSFQDSSLCRSCQTKPIGDGEDPSGAGPFSRA